MFKKKAGSMNDNTIATDGSSNPNVKSSEKKVLFKDWRRRIGEQTLLKFGFASEVKDDVTGDIEGPLNNFSITAEKAALMEAQCKSFCNCLRTFLGQGANMTFLEEAEDDAKELSRSLSLPFIKGVLDSLNEHIEIPLDLMKGHVKVIEDMVKTRAGLLLDYQHHKRKYDIIKEKQQSSQATGKKEVNMDDLKLRQAKLDAAAARLREVTLTLLANFAAFEYTYPRLRKQMASAIAAINGAACKTVS